MNDKTTVVSLCRHTFDSGAVCRAERQASIHDPEHGVGSHPFLGATKDTKGRMTVPRSCTNCEVGEMVNGQCDNGCAKPTQATLVEKPKADYLRDLAGMVENLLDMSPDMTKTRQAVAQEIRDAADALEAKDAEIERLQRIIKTERNWLVKRDEALEKARAALENAIR